MIRPDVTEVKASYGFWEDILAKQFNFQKYFEIFEIKNDQIIIKSDETKDVLELMKDLSKEYPREVFRVKTDSKDYWNNYVQIYECKNGESKLINEGYEYIFSVSSSDGKPFDYKELESFKRKLADFYRKVDQPEPKKIHVKLGYSIETNITDSESDNTEFSYTVKYTTKKSCFSADRHGLTYIVITVEEYKSIF
jgi:hypothetical protein